MATTVEAGGATAGGAGIVEGGAGTTAAGAAIVKGGAGVGSTSIGTGTVVDAGGTACPKTVEGSLPKRSTVVARDSAAATVAGVANGTCWAGVVGTTAEIIGSGNAGGVATAVGAVGSGKGAGVAGTANAVGVATAAAFGSGNTGGVATAAAFGSGNTGGVATAAAFGSGNTGGVATAAAFGSGNAGGVAFGSGNAGGVAGVAHNAGGVSLPAFTTSVGGKVAAVPAASVASGCSSPNPFASRWISCWIIVSPNWLSGNSGWGTLTTEDSELSSVVGVGLGVLVLGTLNFSQYWINARQGVAIGSSVPPALAGTALPESTGSGTTSFRKEIRCAWLVHNY